MDDEIKALELEIAPPPGSLPAHKEEPDFWLELPRSFSFTAARFELPLNMSSLVELGPVDYLSRCLHRLDIGLPDLGLPDHGLPDLGLPDIGPPDTSLSAPAGVSSTTRSS